jgi:hypothetical protein
MAGYEPLGDLYRDELTFEMGTMGDIRVDMAMRMAVFRGQVREFCLSLWMESPAGRFELERVDTCHSEIHRHRFYRDKPEDRVTIYELIPGDEIIVDGEYQIQYEYLITHWELILDRWHRG